MENENSQKNDPDDFNDYEPTFFIGLVNGLILSSLIYLFIFLIWISFF